MSTEDNKALVRRTYAVINKRNLKAIDELVDPNYVGHIPAFPPVQVIEGLQQVFSTYLTAFLDMTGTIEDLIAEGDKVAARLNFRGTHIGPMMGIPPTGKQVTLSAMNIFRVANGKFFEQWVNSDDLGLMQQLGVIPMQG
jgi:predicted ester cyclase